MAVVALDGVHKRYGQVEALVDVDLTVEAGEVVALLGPNGAGKTTAFEILLGLVAPSAGSARVLGEQPGGSVRRRIGAMLQGAGLPDQVTVAELVRLVARAYPAPLSLPEALGRVGLLERAGRTVTSLSGGERQRLLLAMAIVATPELLLLDEPTAAMDVESRSAFWAQARSSVHGGATIVFATHDLAEADAIADRVVVLQSGRVIADAAPSALKGLVAATVIQVTTDASARAAADLPGVERVEVDAASPVEAGLQRLHIYTADAEATIVPLVQGGHRIAGLRIADAGLEDAFRHLTSGLLQVTTTTEP